MRPSLPGGLAPEHGGTTAGEATPVGAAAGACSDSCSFVVMVHHSPPLAGHSRQLLASHGFQQHPTCAAAATLRHNVQSTVAALGARRRGQAGATAGRDWRPQLQQQQQEDRLRDNIAAAAAAAAIAEVMHGCALGSCGSTWERCPTALTARCRGCGAAGRHLPSGVCGRRWQRHGSAVVCQRR